MKHKVKYNDSSILNEIMEEMEKDSWIIKIKRNININLYFIKALGLTKYLKLIINNIVKQKLKQLWQFLF
jgi:hypothetical protein